ncbi:MAG: hypothetical protein HYV94_20675 [Candidatus Rokubacteria bacterium]|nr:hypothetical protein [Candidatus Rokubacteria bacterium]MBI2494490.1 hypothetical protein [Candidatus Rokubacteria bacterium]
MRAVALPLVVLIGAAYEVVLLFTPLLAPYRFPIPYAVPVFDTPFVLAAVAVAYLCLKRHRLHADRRSAVLGPVCWLAALLGLAHILTQPDYPGTPGVNPGIAPYFFFLSYLAAFVGAGLALRAPAGRLALSERARFWVGVGFLALGLLLALVVPEIRPVLPSLVMRPGRLTPFAIAAGGIVNGLAALGALWAGRRVLAGREADPFARCLVLATLIWLFGLAGFLIHPFRYGVSWYVAGFARPVGLGVILLGLARAQETRRGAS